MRVKSRNIKALTKRQREVVDFISRFYQERGYAPSLEEIARAIKVSAVSTIHKHISLIQKKGYLQRVSSQSRGVTPLNHTGNTTKIPLLGVIAAGNPIEPIENPEPIDVPISMISDPSSYYALRVKGDSMIDDDVWDGDVILIKHQNTANTGEMIVAIVDGEATLKRFGGYHDGKIKLIPRNPKYETREVNPESFEIRGKFAGLIRRE